jgi:hypothetical protein
MLILYQAVTPDGTRLLGERRAAALKAAAFGVITFIAGAAGFMPAEGARALADVTAALKAAAS